MKSLVLRWYYNKYCKKYDTHCTNANLDFDKSVLIFCEAYKDCLVIVKEDKNGLIINCGKTRPLYSMWMFVTTYFSNIGIIISDNGLCYTVNICVCSDDEIKYNVSYYNTIYNTEITKRFTDKENFAVGIKDIITRQNWETILV